MGAETKTVMAPELARLNHMFVQRLQALLEELDRWRSPTARFQNRQARGARLFEREQMVTWIVQQVLSTPAHCFACSNITSTNASHNWCVGMAPSSPGFAEWQNHQGHYCYSDMCMDFQKLLGDDDTYQICLSVWVYTVALLRKMEYIETVFCLSDKSEVSH